MQNFKQRKDYQVVKDMINSPDMPDNFEDIHDDSDQTFYQAYS